MKKRILKKSCLSLVAFFLVMTCFVMFGKNVSADDDSKPAPVPQITSTNFNGKDVTISWKLPEGYKYNEVHIRRISSPNDKYGYLLDTVSASTTSYTDHNIQKGVPIYYLIYVEYWDDDYEDWWFSDSVYTDEVLRPLEAPSFSISAGNSHSITLKWKASSDCDGYNIYRSTSKDGTYDFVKTVVNDDNLWWYDDDLTKTFTQKNLSLGTVYYYKIQPYVTTEDDETYYGTMSAPKSAQVTINGTNVKSASSKSPKTNTITWAKNNEASGYIIYYCKTKNGKYTKLKTYTGRNNLSYTHKKLTNGTAYYYRIQSYTTYNGQKLTGPMSTYKKYCDYYTYKNESYESKCKRVFGKEYYQKYKNAKEAKKHMKTITVKVWDQKGKKKFTRKFYLTVNKKLAPSIQEMFKEIYKSKERFPIHDIGCYSWRGNNSNSEHCLGLAFDINPNENYMIDNGKILSGSFWKPKKNRYSIPLNCQLVKILEKYGFDRGLWGSRKDYMHFSYFGT